MSDPRPPLAVVGLSAIFPGSQDGSGFWRDILAGRDLIGDVPPSHWLVEDYYDPDPAAPDKTYARRGAFLSPIEFDPLEHGIPPNVVPATDSSQLLALVAAKQVLDDATAGQFSHVLRERTSVILGATSAQELLVEMGARLQRPVWVKALREHGLPEDEVQRVCDRIAQSYVPWQENTFPGLLGNVVAGRIANRLNLGGTNCITDAACASSLSALQMGANELYLGESDLAIVGGVETFNDIFMYMCFSKTPALSATGDCRPFAKSADGTMLGEGLAMLALRRLADAENDGDRIYALVRGIGSSSDGRNKSVYAPVAEGQARALRRAYATAGYSPASVGLVEAHGTGTKAGDVAEFEGLRQVFDEAGRTGRQWCALGSVKSQVGHTKATAGAAGLFKIVMALHHKVLPPTLKVDEPHPALRIEETPFYLNTHARPWILGGPAPRRASVSSFGFGGSNFHVAVEEYRGAGRRPPRVSTWPAELLLLSAADPSELIAGCRALADRAGTPGALAFLARDSHARYDAALPARLAVVAKDEADLALKLGQAAAAIAKAPDAPLPGPGGAYYAHAAVPGRIALLFPGQGSQYLEMGADAAMAFEAAREVWDRAADVGLEPPLHEIVFPRPVFSDADREALERRLTATEWVQPAIGVASAALLALLRRAGVRADACAGHSFGEVTALYAAGALDLGSFVRVARRRGELMAEAARRPGAMLAVAGPLDAVRSQVAALGAAIVVANHNSPRQVVLSGEAAAIDEAAALLAAAGMTARRLAVATAFHSPIVAGSAAPFAAFLGDVEIGAAACPVYSNAEAAPYPADAGGIRARLAEQIGRPVRFVEMIEALYAGGVRSFVEVGPGAALSGLVSECLAGRPHASIPLDRKGQHGVVSLWHGLGRLAVCGVRLDVVGLLADFAMPKDPLARKKPALSLLISGANYAKPYPPPGGAAALPKPNPPRAGATAAPGAPSPEAAAPTALAPSPRQPAAPAPAAEPLAWVHAYTDVQRQTAEAHEAYLKTMAESHAAFLATAQASFGTLQALLGTAAPGVAEASLGIGAPVAAPPGRGPADPGPPVARIAPETAVAGGTPAPAQAPPPPVPAPVTALAAAASAPVDLLATLLSVVAEKTGYPPDMLASEMELESDLGIDSIKRVEILAAMQERAPGLPDVKPAQVAALRTLADVAAFLGGGPSAISPPAVPAVPPEMAPAGEALAAPPGAGAATNGELKKLLLGVVAEKTGYPSEMLSLEMELEGDLGIDSIKRVEILAALQERVPGLPEVKAAEIAALRTLGQIVARLHGAPEPPGPPSASPAPGAATAERAAPEVGLQRLVLRERSLLSLGASLTGLFSSGPVFLTDDTGGVAPLLAERLRAAGLDARVVAEPPPEARALVLLDGLRPLATLEDALALNRRAFAIARSLAARVAEASGVFVTVQDTGGDFGLSGHDPWGAWLGGLAGLVKTAALEWPAAGVRAIDVERAGRAPQAIAAALADELLAGGGEVEVGLRADGRRTTPAAEPAPAPAADAGIDAASVIVASGGARGVTAACLLALARERQPRVALLGRTVLGEEPLALRGVVADAELGRALLASERAEGRNPSPLELKRRLDEIKAGREVRATLQALAAAGCEALYLAADVTSPVAVAAALAEVRQRLGPITGIVHGAGVIADRRLIEKSDEQFAHVFETKALGLQRLLEATAGDPLRQLVVFSSLAGRAGNEGQADYAMANEVVSKLAAAEARRRGGLCLVKALHWGPWDGGMVNAALRARFEARGVPLIPLEAGARQFVREILATPGSDVEVVVAGAGAGVSLGAAERRARLEFHVDARSHAFLGGHRVKGTPVVPLALALEWMARAAAACRPELLLTDFWDVRVLRGIRLRSFDAGGDAFQVVARETANGSSARLALELRGADGALHYAAAAEMAPAWPAGEPAPEPDRHDPAPWTVQDLYPKLLFHDEPFRVIRALEGLDPRGGVALVAGVAQAGWGGAAWRLDAAALDGGLQLAILLGHLVGGHASLPTGMRRLRLLRGGVAPGDVRCRIDAREATPLRTLSSLRFEDATGELFAEIAGLEMHALPAEPMASDSERAVPALS